MVGSLAVPPRSVADTGSFPVDPAGVAEWLARLDPRESDSDARELLRGLVHSNRLHNDVDRRRAVIARFIPPVRALHERLADTAQAQPLPLTREFARARALAESLLKEESLAFRLLLADSPTPRRDDARRSMHALARLVELSAHGYRDTDPEVLADAHALWRFSEAHGLGVTAADDALASLEDHYRFIIILVSCDPARHRARQLPLLIDWLKRESPRLVLASGPTAPDPLRTSPGRLVIDPERSTLPAPAGAVLLPDEANRLVIETTPLRDAAERRLATLRLSHASVLGADTLERQTLARLSATLGNTNYRRTPRRRDATLAELVFGHQQITAQLLYEAPVVDKTASDLDAREPVWQISDRSRTGMRLESAGCRAGLVQVGELVTVLERPAAAAADAPASGTPALESDPRGSRIDVPLGIVRRVRASGEQHLSIGIELLARSLIPVTITHGKDADAAPEHALIIACRIQSRTLQTMLLPAYLYRTGDRLVATRRERSRAVVLGRCLQMNGLFGHYVLQNTGSRLDQPASR